MFSAYAAVCTHFNCIGADVVTLESPDKIKRFRFCGRGVVPDRFVAVVSGKESKRLREGVTAGLFVLGYERHALVRKDGIAGAALLISPPISDGDT